MFGNRLGDIAAESGRIPMFKRELVRWAIQLLSVLMQRGIAEVHRQSGLVISGMRGVAGFSVPVTTVGNTSGLHNICCLCWM